MPQRALPLAAHRLTDSPGHHPLALGCPSCPDYGTCGGIHRALGSVSCYDDCTCADPTACENVCRNTAAKTFVARVREVGTFDLANVPRRPTLPFPVTPEVVHRIRPIRALRRRVGEPVVAVALQELYNADGSVRFPTREALLSKYRLRRHTQIVVSGVDQDKFVERWWGLDDRPALLRHMRSLGIAAATAPNFSLTLASPRPNDLHAMKRIALCWSEFVEAGIPTALHVNARTERDYQRWADFIDGREEIQAVAFEFGTGARGRRGRWHTARLCELARRVGRPLLLVVRGGRSNLGRLREAYARVVVIDNAAYMKTMHRQRLATTAGAPPKWRTSRTSIGAPLDGLLRANCEALRSEYHVALRAA